MKWTTKQKAWASKELRDIANAYEPKRRKSLRGIRYLSNGSAKWCGHAHDYTVWLPEIKKFRLYVETTIVIGGRKSSAGRTYSGGAVIECLSAKNLSNI